MQRHLAQIAVLAATATFALLFLRTVSWDETRAQLGAIPPTTVLAAVGAVLASLGFTALRWRYLLRAAGVEARVPRLFAGLVAGGAVNNLVPARGGDLVRVRSVPARTSAVVGTLAAERLLDGFVLSLFIVGGVAVTGAAQPLLVAGIGLAVATALAMALASLQPAWLDRLPGWLRGFVSGLAVFRSPGLLARAFGASLALWLADVLMYLVLARAFGLHLSLGGAFLLEGIGNLALAVPATAAGVGTFDFLTLLGTKSVGLARPGAAAYVLALHLLIVLPTTALGVALLWWARPRRIAVGPAVA
jgi:glycosyltransferase 2 family protein